MYYFIKNKIDCGVAKVKWCGSEHMVADYVSKLLLGQIISKLRKIIVKLKE